MCIICVSDYGVKQPSKTTMQNMWSANPHGAGYMYYRDGKVYTRKGFMKFTDFWNAVSSERFTEDDVVAYHFRISTQGGVNPEMTQPFFFTKDIVKTKELAGEAKLGIMHNGIIQMTSDGNKEYSDTAQFVANYLPLIIRNTKDLDNERKRDIIRELIQSRMVFLDCRGKVTLVGDFVQEKDGLIYSNRTYKPRKPYAYYGGGYLQSIM